MRLKVLIVAASVLVIVAVGFALLPKFHPVDPQPAVAFGEGYFSKLKQNQVDEAFAFYADSFSQDHGEYWRTLLTSMNAVNGGITEVKTLAPKVVPVTLGDSSEVSCVLAEYRVSRRNRISDERLMVCPDAKTRKWTIVGHELFLADTGQHFAAGLTVREKLVLHPGRPR